MKEGAFIRFLLILLPVGLLISTIVVIVMIYQDNKNALADPNEAVRLEAAALNRRAVSQKDLSESLKVLTDQIGERHLEKSKELEQTALWIESTLGGGNIGYLVQRQIFEVNGQEVRNLIAELPGKLLRSEIIVVSTHYDTHPGSPGANASGSGVAALISLARAFAGDAQERTVRFAAFVNDASPSADQKATGSFAYAERCSQKEENIVAVLSLESLGCYDSGRTTTERRGENPIKDFDFPKEPNFLAFLGDENSRYFTDSARVAFGNAASIPVESRLMEKAQQIAGGTAFVAFSGRGYPVVSITDTGGLRDEHYGQPTDIVGNVDLTKLEDATKGIEAIIRVWANP